MSGSSDIVGVQGKETGWQHYFELPIQRHLKMRPYEPMNSSPFIELKGTIYGFGAKPIKSDHEEETDDLPNYVSPM